MSMTHKSKTFDFGDFLGHEHIVSDEKCNAGWCGDVYPVKCPCGGLIHANFGDENYDGDYWLYTKCDKCGESE